MADDDIDSFGDHDNTNSHPDDTDQSILLNPGGAIGGGGSSWEPEQKQETSFGGGENLRKKAN